MKLEGFINVLDCEGIGLMSSKNHKKIFSMLKKGLCTIVNFKPFTVKLTYKSNHYVQDSVSGFDLGTKFSGISSITGNQEVYRAEAEMLTGMSDRLTERKMYRKNRRQRLRCREPRFNNRKKKVLMPSVEHLLNSILKLIENTCSSRHTTTINIELGRFDMQKMMNSDINGIQYQQGDRYENELELKAFIKERDGYKCQNPNCKNHDKTQVLHVHHIIQRKDGGSNSPKNLITLCSKCHTPENHANGSLSKLKPKPINLANATKMNIIAPFLIKKLKEKYPDKIINITYGFNTSFKRKQEGIEKSHSNDAFIIASGTNKITRCEKEYKIKFVRRNNRCLSTFRDAKFIDIRTGEKTSGSILNCGRTCRNKNKNGENLRIYRGKKVTKGRVSIRRNRYKFQPNDLISFENNLYKVVGCNNKGKSIILKNFDKFPSTKK